MYVLFFFLQFTGSHTFLALLKVWLEERSNYYFSSSYHGEVGKGKEDLNIPVAVVFSILTYAAT